MGTGASAVAFVLILALPGCARPAEDPWYPTVPQAMLWKMFTDDVIVEVDHVEGRMMDRATIEATLAELRDLTGRSIRLGTLRAIPDLPPTADRVWSNEDLDEIATSTFDDPRAARDFMVARSGVIHVLLLDGRGEGEQAGPLGTAWANNAVVFVDQIVSDTPLARGHPNIQKSMQHTLTHEIGHVLGLVNCGVPMIRDHEGPPCHSDDPSSVMWEQGQVTDSTLDILLPGTLPIHFDEDDRADITAYIQLGERCAIDPGCGASRAAR